MIPGTFEYHRPNSLADAVKLLAGFGDEGRAIAGGHSLIPMMKLRLATPGHLVDLGAITELKGIREEGGRIRIGALTTQHEIIGSELLTRRCPILRETALVIADPQVRYLGTVGGNVANGDPGNDMPAVMQALDATYLATGPGGKREMTARSFYQAAYFTSLKTGEVLTEVSFAAPPAGHGWAYEKIKRKVGDYAVAAAAVLLVLEGGTCRSAGIALTNLGDTPLYAADAVKALVGGKVGPDAIKAAVAAARAIAKPASDMRGSAEYRTHVAGVVVRRAIERALSRAKGA
jgi:aerobic carbon-monoxide dehydrogenase medium subunit